MQRVIVKDEQLLENGICELVAYNAYDFNYDILRTNSFCKTKDNVQLINKANAFDIETTTISSCERPYGFMYHWQLCLYNEKNVIFGTRWEEFIYCINEIIKVLNLCNTNRLVIYCHNLGFEHHFIKDFFEWDKVFAVKEHTPLYAITTNGVEFRCSYKLSNMSLLKFCENSRLCTYIKRGNYDYNKIRTADTPITDDEFIYDYCDVAGLVQCIKTAMCDDNLATIPLTSTGYVRREAREALRKNKSKNRTYFLRTRLDADIYDLCKKAKRGGNTHASYLYSGIVLSDVKSKDKKSSYPYEMVTKKYPMRFIKENGKIDMDRIIECDLSCLFILYMDGVKLKHGVTIPYIPTAKCLVKKNIVSENGRIISAGNIVMALTEVDYKIITNQYIINHKEIIKSYVAEKDFLPKDYREFVMEYFIKKEELNGVDKYLYNKTKNKINSLFGMLMTDIIHPEYIFDAKADNDKNATYIKNEVTKLNELDYLIKEYYRKDNFAAYQHGIYVTAYARESLQTGIDLVMDDMVYTDTDCVKYIGEHDFNALNNAIYLDAENYDVKPYIDMEGKRIYLGYWADEGTSEYFCTAGAKKYATENNSKLEITISGVNKEKGAEYLQVNHGIKAFSLEYRKKYKDKKVVIPPFDKNGKEASGRTASYYNNEQPHYIVVDGCKMLTASNIAVVPTTYSLGTTTEYDDILLALRNGYI
ncbi:MAG TPA: hypothetical protein DEB74_05970 [Lachnospiraceae bacterium]|nr:hypothetical protein [Lachnospiraceae bacterium]